MVALRCIDHAGIATPTSYKYLFIFIRRPLFVGVVLASSLMALSARAVSAQAIVIANISIVDPAARDPVRKATIVVNEGRITAIGRSPRSPPGARIIDGRGTFVVPGLWDMHAHLAALTPIGLAPERYVGYGVLGVRDMGGLADSLLPLKARILAGKRIGPDIVLAGPTLNGEQSADFHRQVVTGAEARSAVRDLKALGVDFIKIHRAIGREAFAAIADETRRLGLAFSGHVPLAMSWIEARAARRDVADRARASC